MRLRAAFKGRNVAAIRCCCVHIFAVFVCCIVGGAGCMSIVGLFDGGVNRRATGDWERGYIGRSLFLTED